MTASAAQQWDEETDILVIGSGAAGGLSAALTATSGGIVWAPGNFLAKAAGVFDPPDKIRAYLRAEFGKHDDKELTEAFIESVPEA